MDASYVVKIFDMIILQPEIFPNKIHKTTLI